MTKQKSYKERLLAGQVQYRAGSNKAAIFQSYMAKGLEAAQTEAKKRKIAESTLKAWVRDWVLIQENKAPLPLEIAKPKSAKKSVKRTSTKAKAA